MPSRLPPASVPELVADPLVKTFHCRRFADVTGAVFSVARVPLAVAEAVYVSGAVPRLLTLTVKAMLSPGTRLGTAMLELR